MKLKLFDLSQIIENLKKNLRVDDMRIKARKNII